MPCNRPARFDNHRVNVLLASKKPLLLVLALVLLAGLSIGAIRPAHAAPVFVVNLDANSISQTDFTIATTAAQTHGFRVGAVLNTTAAIPLLNVQGWQFTIHYNATAFAPQGDPSAQAVPGNPGVLYVDGATNTVLFGANANLKNSAGVTENWNGLLTAGAAFRVVTSSVSGSAGALTVAYSILGTGTQVNVTAVNLLGNVAFELVNKPSTLQSFTISDVIFVDRTGALISNVIAGAGATETVSDSPPVASFTTTHLATGAPDCTPVTGAAGAAYAFKVDGSASTDETPLRTAAGTAGFFWDFGDQQQDGFYPGSTFTAPVTCTNANLVTFTCQGAVAIHDYGVANPSTGIVPAPGKFNVTLRVQDSQLDTGASRNSLGAPYVRVATPPGACSSPECTSNTQPSHGQQLNLLADIPPTASFTPTSTTCTSPCTVTFNAATSAPGQAGTTISSYTWNFGDGNTTTVTANTIFHTFTVASGSVTRTVTLTVTDNLGATGQATGSVMVSAGLAAPTVTVNAPTPNPANEGAPGVTVTWTVTGSSITASCINWGDGSSACSLVGVTSATHVYSTGGVASKVFTITVNATNSAGTGSGTNTVTVNDLAPTVTVTAPASANEGASVSVSFAATDDEAISKTCVNFGDGSSVCAASPVSHVYSTGGVASKAFTITVNATDAAGVTGSKTASITVNDLAPTVTVTAPASANEGASVSVSFTATDDEAISKTCVNFGDGSSVCAASPVSHVYSTGGVASKAFTITVNATDAAGNTGSNTASITINDLAPTVTVTAPASANEGASVSISFTATDAEAISKTCVNFGDGSSVCAASPVSHVYSTGGVASKTFTITVNATDAAGIIGSKTGSITINDLAPSVAITSVTPSPGTFGQPVTVSFTATDDESISKTCISWGDGSSACAVASGVTHSYAGTTSTTFTITVNATDAAGLTGKAAASETVNPGAAPVVTINSLLPNPASEGATVTVMFTVTSSPGAVTSLTVNWGDGTIDTLATTATSDTHIYHLGTTITTPSQALTVTVSATNSTGTGSKTATETVNDLAPTVTIASVSPSPASSGQTVSLSFTATDDESVSKTCISWGDGVSACGITSPVTHVYTVSASTIFTITVNATDAAGLTGSRTATETVNPSTAVLPVVTVNAPTPSPALTGQTVTVTWTVSSSATVTASCINWGDGASACGLVGTTSATHTYANTGNAMSETFTITVNATNSAGTGQGTNMETVNDRPPVAVIAGPSTAITGQTVTFDGSGSTDPDGTITNFAWSFGDSTSGTGAIVTHTYTTVNTFTVTLTVTDNSGKTNSTTHAITVTSPTVHASLAHGKASPAHH